MREYQEPERVDIIGVPISAVTMASALDFVDRCFDQICGGYICASNVHTTVMAHEDPAYWKAQSESVMSLPDGKPLSVVGRKHTAIPMEKVTGTHFMQNIFTDPRFVGKKHFFYGTTQENLVTMIQKVKEDYPGLEICGYEPSVFRPMSEQEERELAERINAADADFIWVAIGAPRQELLMNRLRGQVKGVMVGVGGAFNILSGKVNDAPVWMQNMGLEWFYRLIKEPKRLFKRYLVTNTKFIWCLFRKTERRM